MKSKVAIQIILGLVITSCLIIGTLIVVGLYRTSVATSSTPGGKSSSTAAPDAVRTPGKEKKDFDEKKSKKLLDACQSGNISEFKELIDFIKDKNKEIKN
jgi:hypothetical protein